MTGDSEYQSDEHTPSLELISTCANICYPTREVYGDPDAELQPRHIKYEAIESPCGRCGPRSHGRIYLGLNESWWADHTTEDRLGLLIHELAHVDETSHKPAFWERVAENYKRLRANGQEVVDTVGVSEIDWSAVKDYVVTNPRTAKVDNRSENAYERRLELAKELDYPVDEIAPFDGISYNIKDPDVWGYRKIPISEIDYEHRSLSEIRDWLNPPGQCSVVTGNGDDITLELPRVHEKDGRYDLISNPRVVDFQRYASDDETVRVAVVKEDPVETIMGKVLCRPEDGVFDRLPHSLLPPEDASLDDVTGGRELTVIEIIYVDLDSAQSPTPFLRVAEDITVECSGEFRGKTRFIRVPQSQQHLISEISTNTAIRVEHQDGQTESTPQLQIVEKAKTRAV